MGFEKERIAGAGQKGDGWEGAKTGSVPFHGRDFNTSGNKAVHCIPYITSMA